MNNIPYSINPFRDVTALWFVCLLISSSLTSATLAAGESERIRTRTEATQTAEIMTWRPISAKEAAAKRQTDLKQAKTAVNQVSFDSFEPANGYEDLYVGESGCDAIGCGNTCDCGTCGATSCDGGLWIRAEYLLWSLDGIDLPSLVTTSPTGTLPENTGVIGQAGTTLLFGGNSVLDSYRSGARVTLGWAEDRSGNGFELSAIGIFKDDESFRDSRSLLARPVFDTGTASESSMLIAHPDFLSGSVNVQVSNELMAFDISRRQMLSSYQGQRIDLLLGYRHGQLDEMLRVDQSSVYTAAQGQIISGTTVSLFDDFAAENRFHGAQLGLHFQQRSGPTTFNAIAKLGLGVNRAQMTINGQTTNTVPGGGSATFAGGLLAQTTNIGTYDDSKFMVLPEIGLNLTTQVDRDLQLTIGYGLMYWSDAVRVAGAIDRNVSQFPPEAASGTQQPAYQFATSSFLAHGLNVGAVYSF